MSQTTNQVNRQTKSTTPNNQAARIAGLVRAGAMKASELPALKMALKAHAQKGDIGKLTRSQRDVISRYYQATAAAATGSQQAYSAARRNIMSGYELTRDDYLSESVDSNPPMMLVLKRKGIRAFPDGKRVALYTNDKLGISFTVPYNSSAPEDVVGIQAEETLIENIDHIANIVKTKQAKNLKFDDGSSALVDGFTASAIHQLHKAVNDQNKIKIARMVKQSPDHLAKVAAFAFKQIKK
jgi:hypothetical protein